MGSVERAELILSRGPRDDARDDARGGQWSVPSCFFLAERGTTRETTREVVTGAYRDAIGEWETTLMSRGGEWCFRLTQ